MNTHKEIVFEEEIVAYLTKEAQDKWLEGHSKGYDKKLALYKDDLIAYIKTTQPKEYEKFARRHSTNTEEELCQFIAKELNKHGSLYCLRNELNYINARIRTCQFKPDLPNPSLQARYDTNILRVVRQVYYSEHNNNSIDLVLFLNGIPVATCELKTDFTQRVEDAVNQYKYNRLPKDAKSKKEEPLLSFNKRALVHFAVSNNEIKMATKLEGPKTYFLPFNKGFNGGAGNPPNPEGHATDYLWKEIFNKEMWLRILGRYMHLEVKFSEDAVGRKTKKETLIFPRYHQLDATIKLIEDARANGAGKRYLIQHSAGSGKSNSIAWLAHQLSSLHDGEGKRVFNSIIVVTDRNVLDAQLKDTISQFDHKPGVVEGIDNKGESKSSKLATALEGRVAIIIVTIQTFPFVLDTIRERATLKDRTYAIIADEAHSSQSGNTAQELRKVLSVEQIEEGVELSTEDVLAITMSTRGQSSNISYFAFTATPKAKTMELFGTLPKPNEAPNNENNKPYPFHSYTMQQAIEEGFILDVLASYTTYDEAFRLSTRDNREVEAKRAKAQLARWLTIHPHNISQKVEIIIEHFKRHILGLLGGKAKAMVVTSSRKGALRYKIAFDKYIKEKGYEGIASLVAFSGKLVDDIEGVSKEYTEASANPGLKGRDMRNAFDTDEYQVMLVANKFQTGFDQPKLCAMYVDKRLGGVEAVQTLSRLNRTHAGKDRTFILDFRNTAEEIKEAFEPYYKTSVISSVTDANIIYDLERKILGLDIILVDEVERFADIYFVESERKSQARMTAALRPAVDRFKHRYQEALAGVEKAQRDLKLAKEQGGEVDVANADNGLKEAMGAVSGLDVFKKDLTAFVRMFDFLTQIVDYESDWLEKLAVYIKSLIPNLRTINKKDPIDISTVELTHYRVYNKKNYKIKLEEAEICVREPGGGTFKLDERDTLENIVNELNKLVATEDFEEANNILTNTVNKIKRLDAVYNQFRVNELKQAMMGDFESEVKNAMIEVISDRAQSAEKQKEIASHILGNEEKMGKFLMIAAQLLDYQIKLENN
jgi:type I restriction enzyme R subunit